MPNALIAALIAGGADVHHITAPSLDPTESYRLRDADREFVKARDLTCRIPGYDRPIHEADLDHTIPWGDGGPTHPSNLKGYCRHHHQIPQKPFASAAPHALAARPSAILTRTPEAGIRR